MLYTYIKLHMCFPLMFYSTCTCFLFVSLSTMCTLSRALEASIRDNHANMTRLGIPVPSTFVDPLNPHERKRVGSTPVGVKNIGNTCWFSAVIQVLSAHMIWCVQRLQYMHIIQLYILHAHTRTHTHSHCFTSLYLLSSFSTIVLLHCPLVLRYIPTASASS